MADDIKCKDCAHHVFDMIWGEYKCLLLKQVIHTPEKYKECVHYQKEKSK